MLYFAYGSNMCTARLRQRIGSAAIVTTAAALGYRLSFRKRGRDGSGKCDIVWTGAAADAVHGVVYELAADHKAELDRIEGVGVGYHELALALNTPAGPCRVLSYQAAPGHCDEALRPFSWYREFVIAGATEHRLPAPYLAAIAAVATQPDPDPERAIHNARILCGQADGMP